MLNIVIIVLGIIGVFVLYNFLRNRFIIVPQNHKAIVERFEAHSRVLSQGIHFLWPFENVRSRQWTYIEETISGDEFETSKYISSLNTVSDQVYDCPRFKITTSDYIEIVINPVLFFKYIDIIKVMYTNEDLFRTLQLLVHTELNQINKMTYTQLNDRLSTFEKEVTDNLKITTQENGIEIKSFKIQSLRLPEEIEQAKKKEALIKSQSLLKISENQMKLKQERVRIEHDMEIQKLQQKHKLEEEKIQRDHQILIENKNLEEQRKQKKLEAELEIELNNKISTEKRKKEELEFEMKLNIMKKESEIKLKEIENLMKMNLPKEYFISQLQNESFKSLSNSQNTKWIIPSDIKLIPNNVFQKDK
eukprot:gene12169-5659_t